MITVGDITTGDGIITGDIALGEVHFTVDIRHGTIGTILTGVILDITAHHGDGVGIILIMEDTIATITGDITITTETDIMEIITLMAMEEEVLLMTEIAEEIILHLDHMLAEQEEITLQTQELEALETTLQHQEALEVQIIMY